MSVEIPIDMPSEIVQLPQGSTEKLFASGEMELTGDAQLRAVEENPRLLFKENYFGPDEIESALNIKLDRKNIPPMHFTGEELIRARQLDQRLILRMDRTANGTPITMRFLYDHLQPQFYREGKGEILFHQEHIHDRFFTFERTLLSSWALASNKMIYGSGGNNYFNQTQLLADYLKNKVYKNIELSTMAQSCIEEYEKEKHDLLSQTYARQSSQSMNDATRLLATSSLNTFFMPSAVEVMYDLLVYYQITGKRLLHRSHAYTKSTVDYFTDTKYDFTSVVTIGGFSRLGMSIGTLSADREIMHHGVYMSRMA